MPGPHPHGTPAEERLARLDALATELTARGWTAFVVTPQGRIARLFVQNPHDRGVFADVMAAAEGATGDWWFWFGWAERIAPVGMPDTAAAVIVTELRRPVDVFGSALPAAAATMAGSGRISLSTTSRQEKTMSLRSSMRISVTPYLRPGEQVQAVIGAQTSSQFLAVLTGIFAFLGLNRYRIIAVTPARILVLDAGKFSMKTARTVVMELPRHTCLGPGTGCGTRFRREAKPSGSTAASSRTSISPTPR